MVVPQPPSSRQNEAVSAQVYIHRSVCAQDTDDQADRELQRGRDSNDVALHGHEQTLRRMVSRPWAWFQCCGHAFKAPGHAFQVVGKLPRLRASFRAPGACFRGPGACFPDCGHDGWIKTEKRTGRGVPRQKNSVGTRYTALFMIRLRPISF